MKTVLVTYASSRVGEVDGKPASFVRGRREQEFDTHEEAAMRWIDHMDACRRGDREDISWLEKR